MHRIVALKVFHQQSVSDPEDTESFLREAKATGELRHPNIVAVFEAGKHEDGKCFLASAFIDGVSLREKMRHAQFSQDEAIEIIEKIARAADYAHQHGVIHRDIKPANVLVDETGEPVLVDFGLAKRLDSTLQTREGVAIGTPAYMSPEQSRGEQSQIDGRSDQWSIGVMLYELIAGKRPFGGTNVVDQIHAILNDEPAPVLPNFTTRDRDLNIISATCLSKNREHRYESCIELADDLRRCRTGEPIQARPIGVAEQMWRWGKRNPRVASLLATVNVLLLGMVVIALIGIYFTSNALDDALLQKSIAKEAETTANLARNDAEKKRLVAESAEAAAKQARAEAERQGQAARDRAHETQRALYFLQIRLAQRELERGNLFRAKEIIDNCPLQFRHWEWGHVNRRLQGALKTFTTNERLIGISISTDTKRIAVINAESNLLVLDSEDGKVLKRLLPHKGLVTGVQFHPDGKHIVTAGADNTIKIWNADTGESTRTIQANSGFVSGFDVRGDGECIASAAANKSVKIWDFQSGQLLKELSGHKSPVIDVCYSNDGAKLASAEFTGDIIVWNVNDGTILHRVSAGDGRAILDISFSPNGQYFAACGQPGAVTIWDAKSGDKRVSVQTDDMVLHSICFSPDSSTIAAAGSNGQIYLWSSATGNKRQMLTGHTGHIQGIQFSAVGSKLYSCSHDKTVKTWNARTGEETFSFQTPEFKNPKTVFDRDSLHLISNGLRNQIDLRDANTGRLLETPEAKAGVVYDAVLNSAKNHVAFWGQEGLLVWDAEKSVPLWKRDGRLADLACSQAGDQIALALFSGDEILVVDARNGDVLLTLEKVENRILFLGFRNDEQVLGIDAEGTAMNWDLKSGKLVKTTELVGDVSEPLCFSRNGDVLLTSGKGGRLALWDTSDWSKLRSLKGHKGRAVAGCFSPDGKRVFSAGGDNEILVWDTTTGIETIALLRHKAPVLRLVVDDTGERLYSLSKDGEHRIWTTTGIVMSPRF